MIAFFSILFILLAINAMLLIFSVNGARERFSKPIRKISESSVTNFLAKESAETKYKKAV
ncbi:hypothetical protein [Flagellimonas sp.]|uniref:hypothetical protein n=1 Tax=Flagellimonas sp. TaxID=2058762 RepID=UPI003F4A4936